MLMPEGSKDVEFPYTGNKSINFGPMGEVFEAWGFAWLGAWGFAWLGAWGFDRHLRCRRSDGGVLVDVNGYADRGQKGGVRDTKVNVWGLIDKGDFELLSGTDCSDACEEDASLSLSEASSKVGQFLNFKFMGHEEIVKVGLKESPPEELSKALPSFEEGVFSGPSGYFPP
ncbi:hypothetical protein LWI29_020571 [Acer saccharum]|uniref:Uncharacterized protein n=1 Tax=Acer saccharum TaxID=4024 RepID=A0AA39SKP3_ACESA|nr:hypothetical protein LWI29_020571 [Acer saccharum]